LWKNSLKIAKDAWIIHAKFIAIAIAFSDKKWMLYFRTVCRMCFGSMKKSEELQETQGFQFKRRGTPEALGACFTCFATLLPAKMNKVTSKFRSYIYE
jgi:hypothetical protein